MSGALARPRGREVHVWHARLDDATRVDEKALACLSRPELDRAARFHFDRHRLRFLASHVFLRELLARYLGCPPADVELGEASRGKPELAVAAQALRFNLSHSGDVALAAVADGREVGADVEFLSRERPLDALGPRVLSATELDQLAAADRPDRQRAFLRAWTRKEAVLKASGTGIDRDLTAVEVGITAAEQVVALAATEGAASEWSVASFDPAPGYLGAIAAQGCGLALVTRPYPADPRGPAGVHSATPAVGPTRPSEPRSG